MQPERDGRARGNAWPIRDALRSNPRPRVQVVATVGGRRYTGGTMGTDHPIPWCHAFDGGRGWYTGLGHDEAAYGVPDFIAQLRQGLRYAAGHSPEC